MNDRPSICWSGCAAHAARLLPSDVAEEFSHTALHNQSPLPPDVHDATVLRQHIAYEQRRQAVAAETSMFTAVPSHVSPTRVQDVAAVPAASPAPHGGGTHPTTHRAPFASPPRRRNRSRSAKQLHRTPHKRQSCMWSHRSQRPSWLHSPSRNRSSSSSSSL